MYLQNVNFSWAKRGLIFEACVQMKNCQTLQAEDKSVCPDKQSVRGHKEYVKLQNATFEAH